MCDFSLVRNWLIAAIAAIFVAAAIVIGAAIANGSWWYTYLSPIGMLVAAGATGLAFFFIGRAIDALDAFCTCAGQKCQGPCANLRSVLFAANVVLGIQITACITVALYAWIPYAAQPAQWVIIGAFFVQAGLIITALVFIAQLQECQKPTLPNPGSGSGRPPNIPIG